MKQLNSLVNNTILKIIKIITFRKLESTILKYFIPPIIFIISQKIETMYKVYGFSKTFNLLNIKRKKLFYQHKLHLNHNSIEKRMISELNTNGIATANIYMIFFRMKIY
jgi:hypothetical protein